MPMNISAMMSPEERMRLLLSQQRQLEPPDFGPETPDAAFGQTQQQVRIPPPENELSIINAMHPGAEARRAHEAAPPDYQKYKPSVGRQILAALIAGVGGASGQMSPETAIGLGTGVKYAKWNQAQRQHKERGDVLARQAEEERSLIGERVKAVGSVSDRALRERDVAVGEQGLPIRRGEADTSRRRADTDLRKQIFEEGEAPLDRAIRSRQVGAAELGAKASMVAAERERIGQGQQRVSVDEQEKAEQAVIDRMARVDPRIEKYFQRDENTGYWTPLTKVSRPLWTDRSFDENEQREYQQLQAEIDKRAEEMATGTRFNPRPGFGNIHQ